MQKNRQIWQSFVERTAMALQGEQNILQILHYNIDSISFDDLIRVANQKVEQLLFINVASSTLVSDSKGQMDKNKLKLVLIFL